MKNLIKGTLAVIVGLVLAYAIVGNIEANQEFEYKLNPTKIQGYLIDNIIRPLSIQESPLVKNCYDFTGTRKAEYVTGMICPNEKLEYEIRENRAI